MPEGTAADGPGPVRVYKVTRLGAHPSHSWSPQAAAASTGSATACRDRTLPSSEARTNSSLRVRMAHRPCHHIGANRTAALSTSLPLTAPVCASSKSSALGQRGTATVSSCRAIGAVGGPGNGRCQTREPSLLLQAQIEPSAVMPMRAWPVLRGKVSTGPSMRNRGRGSAAVADKLHTVPPTVTQPMPWTVSTKPSMDGPDSTRMARGAMKAFRAYTAIPTAATAMMMATLSLPGTCGILAAERKRYKGNEDHGPDSPLRSSGYGGSSTRTFGRQCEGQPTLKGCPRQECSWRFSCAFSSDAKPRED